MPQTLKRLILVGGGHAHLPVLQSLARDPWPTCEVLLLTPHPRQIYSGMLPGWMAGHYRLDECAIPLAPLARAAGVRLIEQALVSLDAERKLLRTDTGEELAYDVLSLATGAEVEVAGSVVREEESGDAAGTLQSLPIRPLEAFVTGWDPLLERARACGRIRLGVLGGGAAGIELALAAQHRLAALLGPQHVELTLFAGAGPLPGHGPRIRQRVERCLQRRAIEVVRQRATPSASGVVLSNGSTRALDALLAAPGIRPPAWVAGSGLARSADGFVAVGEGQQSVSHPNVFAGGDIARRIDRPHDASGVYAVRAGPVLAANLRLTLQGSPPRPYVPQARSLYLLATGPREAILSWSGLTAEGRWVWAWKDWIDRRFVRRYAASPAA